MTAPTRPRRPREGLPILIELDPESPEPLFRQIYRAIRDGIVAGRLGCRMRLPATRVLAGDLGVARNTVVVAFEQLAAEGYVTSRVGRGTRVADVLPESLGRAARCEESCPAPHSDGVAQRQRAVELTRLASPKSTLGDASTESPTTERGWRPPAFRLGVPALDHFPMRAWQRVSHARARRMAAGHLEYGSPLGATPLRQAIARYTAASRGVQCTPEQVLIVSGAQQALRLAADVLLDHGDVAWVEDPGYQGAVGALTAAGASVIGVPVDREGLDVEAGRARAPDARLAYVSPSHQFPLGVTMSLARRTRLLEWAAATGAWVLEDDYDSEFRHASRPLTALQGLDGGERVVYCGTMSKVLFPALRIGYLIVPSSLVEAFASARLFMDGQQSLRDQLVLADFIDEGHFERHVRRMRMLYGERRLALIAAVAAELGDVVTLGPSEGGMHAVLWLPDGINARAVQRLAAERDLDTIPVSAFAIEHARGEGLVLGYAHMDEPRIREGCRALAEVVERARRS